MVRFMVDRGISPLEANVHPPLRLAARNQGPRALELTRFFLNCGLSPVGRYVNDTTPLHEAVRCLHPKQGIPIVLELLGAGADVNALDPFGITPLATLNRRVQSRESLDKYSFVFRTFLKHGFDLFLDLRSNHRRLLATYCLESRFIDPELTSHVIYETLKAHSVKGNTLTEGEGAEAISSLLDKLSEHPYYGKFFNSNSIKTLPLALKAAIKCWAASDNKVQAKIRARRANQLPLSRLQLRRRAL